MVELGEYVLGEQVALGYVRVATQDKGLDTNVLVCGQFGCDLVRVADDCSTGT